MAGAVYAHDPSTRWLGAATLYALHHGLAKGALFMGVGVAARTARRRLWPVLGLLLSVTGLPLTGGAFAKLAIKPQFGSAIAEFLVTLSAAGTTLLLARFLWRLKDEASDEDGARPAPALLAPWIVTLGEGERALTFSGTLVRVGKDSFTEMHIDTDEANAAGLGAGAEGEIVATASGLSA